MSCDRSQEGIFVAWDVPLLVKGQLDIPRAQRTPSWEIPVNKPYNTWIFMDKLSARIPRLNTINTMVVRVRERGPHLEDHPS